MKITLLEDTIIDGKLYKKGQTMIILNEKAIELQTLWGNRKPIVIAQDIVEIQPKKKSINIKKQ